MTGPFLLSGSFMVLSALSFVYESKKSEIASLQQLLQLGRLVGAISHMVHMLQRERGTANIYLCSHRQMGGEQLSERALQVQTAEDSMNQLLTSSEFVRQNIVNAARLFSRIAMVLHSLGTLPLLRQQVQALSISQPEAMKQYNDVIRAHLALVFETADISSDPLISRALLALCSFMQGKELAGQERATAAAGFAARQFDESTHLQLMDLIDSQDRCFQTFKEFADSPCRLVWQQQMSQQSSDFERYRRIACTRLSVDEGGSDMALRWFDIATARMDGMKIVENELEEALMTCCRQRISEAQASLALQQQSVEHLPQPEEHYPALLPAQLSRSVLELVEQQSRQLQALDTELARLRVTLAERKLVERAKSVLIQQHGFTEPQAHKTLREMAMNQNKKLSEVAEAMLAVSAVLNNESKAGP
jgi:hypothetical protein